MSVDELATALSLRAAQCCGAPKRLAYVFNDVGYTRGLLLAAFRAVGAGFTLATDRRDAGPLALQIDEYEELLWDEILAGRLVANAYCVRKGLIRKGNFAAHVAKMAAKQGDPVLARGIPHTLVISTWEAFQDTGAGKWGFSDL